MESHRMDFIDLAFQNMRNHIDENISLGDLSKQYNYSVSRFSNLFKQKNRLCADRLFFTDENAESLPGA